MNSAAPRLAPAPSSPDDPRAAEVRAAIEKLPPVNSSQAELRAAIAAAKQTEGFAAEMVFGVQRGAMSGWLNLHFRPDGDHQDIALERYGVAKEGWDTPAKRKRRIRLMWLEAGFSTPPPAPPSEPKRPRTVPPPPPSRPTTKKRRVSSADPPAAKATPRRRRPAKASTTKRTTAKAAA